jgi:oxygen-dependent protoporphyrinogen oxidase
MGPSVAVIGGGISGLAAANRLRELDSTTDVILLEAGSRLGGVLETVERDGFLLEAAADNFLTQPVAAVDLCQRLELSDELLGTHPQRRQALVVHRGQLQPIPAGFLVMAPSRIWPVLESPILSLRGKLRLGLEYFLPRGSKALSNDESLASFVCRRFGREVFERLVQPLVGGIYTADADRLSMESTLPRFRQMEREHGSLLRAAFLRPRIEGSDSCSGARYGQFAALRSGMSSLVKALAARLPTRAVQLQSPVMEIEPLDDVGWRLAIGGDEPRQLDVDAVIVAMPAHRAAKVLHRVAEPLSQRLKTISYATCAVVSLGYRREQIAHPLNASGFVVPLAEQRLILSCSFASQKYAGRAPEDSVLLRVFIGGACQSHLLQLPRSQLMDLAEHEVRDLLQIRGDPVLRHIVLQQRAMPQYHVGHADIVAAVDRDLSPFPTLALAGNALRGVGIPACIASGEAAAQRVLTNARPLRRVSERPEFAQEAVGIPV